MTARPALKKGKSGWLEEQDFYELMQAYRHAPAHEPAVVSATFEAVKAYILDKIDLEPWYSEHMFTPLSDTEIKQIGELLGSSVMSRLHAGWGRHMGKVVKGVA